MKIKSIFMGLASLLLVTSAEAVTKIGTFGQGMQFFVSEMERGQEGTVNTVAVKGHLVNQYGVPAVFELNMICKPSGVIYVSFAGKNWDMQVKDRKRMWEKDAPSMGGYFAIYDRYCTAKYQKSPMSNRDRNLFEEND